VDAVSAKNQIHTLILDKSEMVWLFSKKQTSENLGSNLSVNELGSDLESENRSPEREERRWPVKLT
jgi:hypothetical protein